MLLFPLQLENMKLTRMMEFDSLAQPVLVPANPQLLDGLPFGVLQFQHSASQQYGNSTVQQRKRGQCNKKGAECVGTELLGGPVAVGSGEDPVDLQLLLLVLAFTLGLTAGVGGSMLVGWRCGVVVLGSVA